ncbi:MAG TPA: cell division protein FtsZ [bacterium]|jgi:cell division protein FtsZ
MKFSFAEDTKPAAVIKVVGCGGGGNNALNNMIASGIKGVDFIALNTDRQALERSLTEVRVQIGNTGLGAGARPEIGKQAATASIDAIRSHLEGADMVFVTAGMGGGTGTGSAPVVAAVAREVGALTVAVVTKPFGFEGKRRMRIADEGLAELRREVDTVIVIPNQRLISVVEGNLSFLDAFGVADEVLTQAVNGISELITTPGYINLDFADVRTVMKDMGAAVMGSGRASGEGRAEEAALKAISSPLLEDSSIDGARGVLINITGGSDMTLAEMNSAATLVQESAHEDAEIIFGSVFREDMNGEIRVTVIATGFEDKAKPERLPQVQAQPLPKAVGFEDPAPFGVSREIERQPTFLRKESGTIRVQDRGHSPRTFPAGEDLDIPTFLRKQID